MKNGQIGYNEILKDIIENGYKTSDRTGVGVLKLFNQQLKFDLNDGKTFPVFTARPAPLRFAFEEFWMFLRGETDTKTLEKKNIKIWKAHTSREFLDSRGLYETPEGDLGKSYSYQYTNFGGQGVNQIKNTIENIKKDPFSRRHLVSIWNPADADEMPLLPCFFGHQFYVYRGENGLVLNLKVYSRSWDILFGGSVNVPEFSLYLLAVSRIVGMKAGEVVFDATDCHIYNNQIDYVKELLTREMYDLPSVDFISDIDSYENMIGLEYGDVSVSGLKVNKEPFKTEKPPIAV